MSYILDALQRADAERARGGVPGLHARQVLGTAAPRAGARRLGLWWTLAVLAVLCAVAAGLWLTRAPQVATAPTPSAPVAPSAMEIAAPAPAPAPAPALKIPVAAAEPVVITSAALPVKPRPMASVPAIAAKPAQAVAPIAHASAAATTSTVPWFAELPEDVRRQIPKITITGAVYSDNPAQRLLLVNGLVLNQGSEVAPELSLLEIHSANSEFMFRGTRFRMAH